MEKTYLRTINCRIAFIASLSLNILGIILLIVMIIKQDMFASIASFCVSNFFSLFGWFAYYMERKGKIVLTENSITFYYRVFTKPRTKLSYDFAKGYKVSFEDIDEYSIDTSYGDGIMTADTTWYNFILNDGTIIRFALFHFGKKQEIDIKNSLDKLINK